MLSAHLMARNRFSDPLWQVDYGYNLTIWR